jgi:hypothetical protein
LGNYEDFSQFSPKMSGRIDYGRERFNRFEFGPRGCQGGVPMGERLVEFDIPF